MIKPPKIKYKKFVNAKMNPNNLLRIKINEDFDEFLEPQFCDIKREPDFEKKIIHLGLVLEQTVGVMINREFLMELLEFIELRYDFFVEYLEKMKKSDDLDTVSYISFFDWFYSIDEEFYSNVEESDETPI